MKMVVMIHSLLSLIGLLLIALGIQLFFSSRNFRVTGIKTHATVIDNISVQSTNSRTTSIMYAPLLEYNVDGEKKTFSPNSRSNPPTYDIGEKVPIVYSPRNYQNVRIVSYWGIYMGSNILLALGIPMLLIGIGYFLFKWGMI